MRQYTVPQPSPFCPGGFHRKTEMEITSNRAAPGWRQRLWRFLLWAKKLKIKLHGFCGAWWKRGCCFFGSWGTFPPDCTSHFKGFIISNIIIFISGGCGGGLKLQTNASTHKRGIVNALCYSNITNYTFCGLLSVAPWWALPQINENFSIPCRPLPDRSVCVYLRAALLCAA